MLGQRRDRFGAAILVLLFVVTVTLTWMWHPRSWTSPKRSPASTESRSPVSDHSTRKPNTAQSPAPTPRATARSAGQEVDSNSARLLIPVAGVRPEQLRDTFTDSRSEGRAHDAIDIPAARGTAVLAAADGKIARLFTSARGGMTIYQLGQDGKTVYYYAHLDHYADDLVEGRLVRQGETIAYVGDTGNAGAGNYHLHFAMWLVEDPKRYWSGTSINPYPLLRGEP
jgi:peptidoglycan LD-endopeptidase LytH